MAGSRALKNRIKSTKNIRQMTRAMEAVSAVKMRRSVGVAVAGRPYALAALRLLENVRGGLSAEELSLSPLLAKRTEKRITLLVITSDKGLAGAFNTSVLREADRFIKTMKVPVDVIAIGKKARDYYRRRNMLVAEFIGAGDFGAIEQTRPIALLLEKHFTSNQTDRIVAVYANFISALRQEVISRELLPITVAGLRAFIDDILPERGKYVNMPAVLELPAPPIHQVTFEPSGEILLHRILSALLEVEVHQAILEANASEHSARMMAMKSASENADELAGSLTILYNKARQAQITKELAEITAGKEAQNAA